jgi:hypothetical protein
LAVGESNPVDNVVNVQTNFVANLVCISCEVHPAMLFIAATKGRSGVAAEFELRDLSVKALLGAVLLDILHARIIELRVRKVEPSLKAETTRPRTDTILSGAPIFKSVDFSGFSGTCERCRSFSRGHE